MPTSVVIRWLEEDARAWESVWWCLADHRGNPRMVEGWIMRLAYLSLGEACAGADWREVARWAAERAAGGVQRAA